MNIISKEHEIYQQEVARNIEMPRATISLAFVGWNLRALALLLLLLWMERTWHNDRKQ